MNDDGWAYPPKPPTWPPAPSATPPRRSSRTLMVIATFAATGIIAAAIGVGSVLLVRHVQGNPSSTTAPTTAPSTNTGAAQARALYQQAISRTSASKGFHYVAVSGGGDAQTIIGDAGQSGGQQAITFVSSYGTEQFRLLLVGPTVYFQGNTPAVEDQLGVSTATAPTIAGKWVSVSRADGPYAVLHPGITTSSQSTEITLVPTSATKITVAGGVSATRIGGPVPSPSAGVPAGTGYLDVAPSSDLPITYVSTIAAGTAIATFTINFTNWGTAPSVSAPAQPVAWSTLTTSAPPGGYGSGGGSSVSPTPTPGGAI